MRDLNKFLLSAAFMFLQGYNVALAGSIIITPAIINIPNTGTSSENSGGTTIGSANATPIRRPAHSPMAYGLVKLLFTQMYSNVSIMILSEGNMVMYENIYCVEYGDVISYDLRNLGNGNFSLVVMDEDGSCLLETTVEL